MEVSCVIPAYNEESTVRQVIEVVRKIRYVDEIIVVDDGSTDRTGKAAMAAGAKVISHQKNRGKGAAIKTGIANSSGEILIFLDADISNLSAKKVTSILHPLINDEADFVKSSFSRSRGRVTELVVKPLFKVIFPFINLKQPLSGQFAIRKGLVSELKIDDKWGVDIQILLQLVKKGVRIKEVDIGFIRHKKQPMENLAEMSEQVIKTMLSELGLIANRHKLIIFDLDKTLIAGSSIEFLAEEFGFTGRLKELRKKYFSGQIKDSDLTTALAEELRGKTLGQMEAVARKMRLQDNADKVIDRLKKKQYELAIVSHAFSPIVNHFADLLGIDNVMCPTLISDSSGRLTGKVAPLPYDDSGCCGSMVCKHVAADELMRRLKVKKEETICVADGASDRCLFRACGLALAYNSIEDTGDVLIRNLSELLIYAD